MEYQDMIAIYEKIAGISSQMLAAARNNDWDKLALLESACTEQITILKRENQQMPLTVEERGEKVRIIQTILENDRKIRDIADPWMAQLSMLMHSTSAERKLNRAYGG